MNRWSLVPLLLTAAGAYVLYLLGMVALQDQLVFPVPGGVGVDQLDAAAVEVGATPFRTRTTDGRQLYGWHRRAGGDKAVLYFHGNGETVAANVALQRLVTQQGFDFVTVAYGGYPGSEGEPSEDSLHADALALWTHATETLGIAPERIVFHGRSLGGGVAIRLATETNPAALVLESTFHSLLEIAQQRAVGLPVRWLLRHPFESWRHAPRVGVPVLQLHSRDDGLIPVDHARRLQHRFAEGTYVESEGLSHNDVLPAAHGPSRTAYLDFLHRAVPDG
jgi:alpha-beta hydrolase superfamily lysophospholipase